jgi:hypothetical protein
MRAALFKLLKLLALLVLLLLAYTGWLAWDVQRLRGFCDALSTATPVVSLPERAQRHGIEPRWVQHEGLYIEDEGVWLLAVPAASTMGDTVCAVRHDKTRVLSAVLHAR